MEVRLTAIEGRELMLEKADCKNKIINELDNLNWEQQKKILDYLLWLKLSESKGTRGEELLVFSGAIDQEDLAVMEKAISEGCEKIDANDW